MDQFTLNLIFVGASFALYFGIAIWARAGSTAEFYAAGSGVHPVLNGMATGADWMSAASFISMAGLISFGGYDTSAYLMGGEAIELERATSRLHQSTHRTVKPSY